MNVSAPDVAAVPTGTGRAPASRRAGLLLRTVAQLDPSQIGHRIRLRAQRSALARWPEAGRFVLAGPDPATATGWPVPFRPLDARDSGARSNLAALEAGRITLIGMARDLGGTTASGRHCLDWLQADAPRTWRFHLHYWDWAWGLVAEKDRASACEVFARTWLSWQLACDYRHPDAWHPYPASLRAWSWCGLHAPMVAGSDIDRPFTAELAAHFGFLRRHLEWDVGGNHLIKNLKALAGLSVFFSDHRSLRRTMRHLGRQLVTQVLPDGGHYERAPAYHCQVLADLVDVAELLGAAGEPSPIALDDAISDMSRWLEAVLSPDGRLPMLNDGYPVPPPLLARLRQRHSGVTAATPTESRSLLILPDTGLVKATSGPWQLLADVGAPCPRELPAHAHADSLGCLLHLDGVPVLVDTGTSTYEAGAVRDYERSTAAHNTVCVDGADSTEVWGAFRAARRARVTGVSATAQAGGVTIEASHDGYRRLPGRPVHRRRWSLTADGLVVDDLVTGCGRHRVSVHWHLAPEVALLTEPGPTNEGVAGPSPLTSPPVTVALATPAGAIQMTVSADATVSTSTRLRPVALGFGHVAPAADLVCSVEAMLPVRLRTRLSPASRSPSLMARDTAAATGLSEALV